MIESIAGSFGSSFGSSFAGSLAAQALSRDPFWGIERNYAESVFFALLGRSHADIAAEAKQMALVAGMAAGAASLNARSDKTPEQIVEAMASASSASSTIVLPGRNIADMSGTVLTPMGQNADGSRKPYPVDGGVARLAITGPMSKEETWCMDGTSTVRARRIIRLAMNDDDVKTTLIRFDCPGGTVRGNDDLAADVRALALKKPTYAYCEDMCASAAYYVASQCNAIYANPSALIGSIATIMSFIDYSEMLEKAGIKVDVITPDDAPFKGAGTPGTALTPDQRAYYQGLATTFAGQFRSAVKRGRNFSDAQLAKVIDGRVWIAAEARSLGLIDGVTSYDNVLAKLKTYRAPK